jgi:hypothetical protein
MGWGRMGVLDRTRLEQAASLLLEVPRSHEDRVRYSNAVNRLIRAVEARRAEAEPW